MPKKTVTIQLSKNHGAPRATVFVGKNAKLATVQGAVEGLFADRVALKSVGLKFCEGCKSGLDIWITDHFEEQINVPGLG